MTLDKFGVPYNIVDGTYLEWLYDQEVATQDLYIQYREYYDGDHDTSLTARLRAFLELKTGQEFNINFCPVVVDSLAERLRVIAFEVTDDEAAEELIWKWWQLNRMDGEQAVTHLAAVRDGDAFIITEWDEERGIPRFTFELACASAEGVKIMYNPGNRKEILMASKRWIVKGIGEGNDSRRLNLYFPDHVEKYFSQSDTWEGNWQPYTGGDDSVIIAEGVFGNTGWHDWLDKQGKPLGVPVAHFKNKDAGLGRGLSELADVLPIQNALNKSFIDMIAAADTAGFPVLTVTGADGGALEIFPGSTISSTDPETKFAWLSAGDLNQMVALKDSVAIDIARVTRTPLSNFQISGQMPAEGSEKQRESGLVSKALNRQVFFGNAHEDAIYMGIRLHNAFSTEAKINPDVVVSTVWKSPETRNNKEVAEILVLKKSYGIPEEQLWQEDGYDATQIAEFRRAKARRESMAVNAFVTGAADDTEESEDEEDEEIV